MSCFCHHLLTRRILLFNRNILENQSYLHTNQSLTELKLQLIKSEIDLIKHDCPDKVPSMAELSPSQLSYLLFWQETRKYRKLCWLDISYRQRYKTLQRFKIAQNFNGHGELLMPLVGYEVEKLSRRKQITMIPYLQNIVFDLSFDTYMSTLECKNLAEQLLRIFQMNRFKMATNSLDHCNIFNLHLTDMASSLITKRFLNTLLPNPNFQFYPNVFLHERSFLDIFCKKNIIYLSPHASETINRLNANDVLIIGGIVDRRQIIQLTTSKCNHLGLRTMRLPEDGKKLVKSLDDVFIAIRGLKH